MHKLFNWLTGKIAPLKIALVNGFVLTCLLYYWTDPIELWLRFGIRMSEFLQLIGIGLLCLIVVYLISKKYRSHKNFKKYALLAVLLISGFHYAKYLYKLVDHSVINRTVRRSIIAKMESHSNIGFGTLAEDLDQLEYAYLSDNYWLQEISKNADQVVVSTWYEGFLPDYFFYLKYQVPLNEPVDEFDESVEEEMWVKKQYIEYDSLGKKWVIYKESAG